MMCRILVSLCVFLVVPVVLGAQTGTKIDNANRVQVNASLDHATKVASYKLRIVRDGQTVAAKADYALGKPTVDTGNRFFVCDASPSAANCPTASSVRVPGLFCDGLADGAYRFQILTTPSNGNPDVPSAIFTGAYLACGSVAPASVAGMWKVN